MKNRRSERGMTLTEVMIASTILLFVIIVVYTLILTTQTTHLTEGRKLDMSQGARTVEQLLTDSLRSAGAVLTMANTPTMLGPGTTAPFTGLCPLNNNDYPDGLIVAAGDPDALTNLTADFTPGNTTVNLTTVNLPDNTAVAWHANDLGLVMRTDGYYVFKVTATPALGATQLTVREAPAYYSGLLSTTHYNDPIDDQLGVDGNTNDYVSGRPVVRLDYFYILLVRTETDNSKTLTLSTDLEGEGDVVNAAVTTSRGMPVVPNIEDLQIEYLTEESPTVLWANLDSNPNPCADPNGADCQSFIGLFNNKTIQTARVFVLLRTEEEKNKMEGSGIPYRKPTMGDVAENTLPVGRYHYNFMQFEVLIRNYGNVY